MSKKGKNCPFIVVDNKVSYANRSAGSNGSHICIGKNLGFLTEKCVLGLGF